MNFPTINHIDDILPFIAGNKQIRVKKCETTGHTVVCYMVQDEDTFAGEHEHWEREARGLTFGPDGKVSARTMHKFFNIGQRDDVKPETIRWVDVDRIMEKRDGSMITPVLVNGHVKCKTKKSFTTKEATLADEVIEATAGGKQWIYDSLISGMTPTFEITSPKYPIVVVYKQTALTLLHIRVNTTGEYLTEAEIRPLHSPFPLVANRMREFMSSGVPSIVSWELLEKYAKETQGIEGMVIQFKSGDMVKLKTVWYMELHRAVTFTRWRDIARSVVADTSDDLKGAFALTGREILPIIQVENAIRAEVDEARGFVERIVAEGQAEGLDPKGMALKHKGLPLFGQIMNAFRGKEINWMEWYERTLLDDTWSLEVVGEEE